MKFGRPAIYHIAFYLAGGLSLSVAAQAEDGPAEAAASTRTQSSAANQEADKTMNADGIAALKGQIALQQKQIEQLRLTLEAQQRLLDRNLSASGGLTDPDASVPAASGSNVVKSPFAKLGEVASRTGMAPVGASSSASLQKPGAEGTTSSPISFGIGAARFTPFGFVDLTEVIRSTNTGGSIGTGFNGIPFNNTVPGKLSESRFSLQNSRVGLRVDSNYKGTDITGYLETDFLGNAPSNLVVSSNSATLRLRLYWVQLKRDKWELLGGQSWSLMTPGRRGISPIPGDLFYSQDVDTNYQAGLTWARQPTLRFVYKPTKAISWAIAAEASDPFIGGAVTIPAALNATAYPSEFDNNASGTAAPPLSPDFVTKLAVDSDPGGKHMHAEVSGLLRTFRVYNPLTNQHFTHIGGGGEASFNLELVKGFRVIANGFVSDGGGRYIFGQVPDLIAKTNGDISLIHSASTVDGVEYSYKPSHGEGAESLFYAYYGGTYARKDYGIDTSGKSPALFGYGYAGGSLGANRSINEFTVGLHQTFWKSANYGDIRLLTQYSYLSRDPWSVPVTNTQRNAYTNMVFINLRYDLP